MMPSVLKQDRLTQQMPFVFYNDIATNVCKIFKCKKQRGIGPQISIGRPNCSMNRYGNGLSLLLYTSGKKITS